MLNVLVVCVKLKSSRFATVLSKPGLATGATLNGTGTTPAYGPVATAATFKKAVDETRPPQNIVAEVPEPTVRTMPSASSHHGTVVCTTMFPKMGRVSNILTPVTPADKSQLELPGVVTASEIRPKALMRKMSPTLSRLAAIVYLPLPWRQLMRVAEVCVGPSDVCDARVSQ